MILQESNVIKNLERDRSESNEGRNEDDFRIGSRESERALRTNRASLPKWGAPLVCGGVEHAAGDGDEANSER